MIALREIALHVACSAGLCCSDSDHDGARIAAVALYPKGCEDASVMAVLHCLPARKSPGMEVWLVERLAELAPLVCFVGGHPVDVPALVVRLSKGSVWS